MEDNRARKQQRIQRSSIHSASVEDASKCFSSAVKEGPDYVCTCCHRLMYRKTEVQFKPTKYSKFSEEFMQTVFPPAILRTSTQQKIWVCRTCDYTLKRGKMPAQAKANNLVLEDVPVELSDLNTMEVRLISLRIPFMKMVALPCGKQRAIHGPAVNVPTDLHPVCNLLPRLPSQAQVVPMKLKRKLCYKGHYMYKYVRPAKVMAALEWLKVNNPLYQSLQVNSDWQHDAAQDDTELWDALSSQHSCQSSQGVAVQARVDTASMSPERSIRDSAREQVDEDMATLTSLARDRGFVVRDVPRDGNCLFSAVQLQLQKIGVQNESDTLRQRLVTYLQNHPYTHDGSCHLREFVAAPVANPDSYNADTEQPDEQDQLIDSIPDTDTQLQLRWSKYLQRLGSTAWGDHIAVQGLADMLHVDIHVLATLNPDTNPITSMSCFYWSATSWATWTVPLCGS